jgi:DNA-binding beta-propeller fold protein YncE
MDSKRFDFLEIGDQTPPAPQQEVSNGQSPVKSGPDSDSMQKIEADQAAILPPLSIPRQPQKNSNEYWIPGRPAPRKAPERLAEVRVAYDQWGQSAAPQYVAPRPAASKAFKAIEVFGSRGDKAGEFQFPAGLAVDHSGILWVADSYNHRLQRITPDGGVAVVGSRGLSHGQFMTPIDVAVDFDRSFYVLENGSHRFQKFSAEGVLQFVAGRHGAGPGELRNPMSIAVSNVTGDIYIADTGNSRVQRFDKNGQYIASFGGENNARARILNVPQAIECDRLGQVYVADAFDRRVIQFDPSGRFLSYYGGSIGPEQKHASANLNLDEPRAIGCSHSGKLYVIDGQHGRGKLIVIDAESGQSVLEYSQPGKSLGSFNRPGGIAPLAGDADEVYIADTLNHRIIRCGWR